jgi:hypothetical protein
MSVMALACAGEGDDNAVKRPQRRALSIGGAAVTVLRVEPSFKAAETLAAGYRTAGKLKPSCSARTRGQTEPACAGRAGNRMHQTEEKP